MLVIRIAIALSLMAAPAAAQTACGPRDVTIPVLTDDYGEERVGYGLGPRGVIEVYASPNGSFTVLLTLPSGLTCLLASGVGWEPETLPDDDGA